MCSKVNIGVPGSPGVLGVVGPCAAALDVMRRDVTAS